MPISSNTLFHFTPTAEYLISILTHEFHPRYCLEKFKIGNKNIEIGIPMICFCDIPLSQIKNHVNTYGHYGLGMTKQWAEKKKLNPILYLKDKSSLSINLAEIIDTFKSDEFKNIPNLLPAKSAYLKIIRYLKPYEGDFLRGDTLTKNVRFYNEREWRFTPEKIEKTPYWLNKEDFNNAITRAHKNKALEEQKLTFEPDDIAYIIVKDEKEIFPMIEALKVIKEKYDKRTIEILNSRIITCDQILNDF